MLFTLCMFSHILSLSLSLPLCYSPSLTLLFRLFLPFRFCDFPFHTFANICLLCLHSLPTLHTSSFHAASSSFSPF
uniref:Secreted peptide n=1 Tax=Anopheles braziliensis TaxID=58242 RepID=A0A2M3ZL41_9DIPT